jgi:general secretion pathway protein K
MRTPLTQQRGTALVTVLLAITLLTVVVIEFAYSTQVDISLARNNLKTLQASYLARSGVNLALLVLQRDAETSSGIDAFGEDWARTLPPLPAGQGVVVARITDEQGKLNLNALRNANGTINGLWREVAERVLPLRGVAVELLDPLLDWLDSDDFPEPHGAEKNDYLSLTPPYTPGNGPFLTLGELGRVQGFTPAVCAALDPVVTVLPSRTTKINVNTAPLDILVALFPGVDPEALERFFSERVASPVRGPNELRERLGIDPRTPLETLRLITVGSEYFSIHAAATVVPVSQALAVTVHRRAATVTPIYWHPTRAVMPQRGSA